MTEPSTQPSVRKLRHSIQKRAYMTFQLMRGAPGATKDQQIECLDQTIQALTEALEKAKQARDIVFLRDFDAHQAAKAVSKVTAEQQGIAANSLPDSPEKAQEALTFDEIVAKLSGETMQEIKDTDPKKDDTPPF